MNPMNDPFAAADNPVIPSAEYFGKLEVDAWFCALVKGQGKVPFDPAQHPADQRRTAVDLHIIPLPEMSLNYPLSRSLIAESKEWSGVVWDSLRGLGVESLRDLKDNDRWCRATTATTGRTYQSNGITKDATTFRFLDIYPDESACRAAYQAARGGDWLDSAPAQPAANGNGNKERETALAFAAILVKQATSLVELDEKLKQFPLVSKYFSVDSPEILAMAGEMAPF